MHRFCNIAADILSSQLHITRIPPGIFSILMLHRGTIIIPDAIGDEPDIEDIPGIIPPGIIPGIDIPAIGIPDPIPIWPPIIIPRSTMVIVLIFRLQELGRQSDKNQNVFASGHRQSPDSIFHFSIPIKLVQNGVPNAAAFDRLSILRRPQSSNLNYRVGLYYLV